MLALLAQVTRRVARVEQREQQARDEAAAAAGAANEALAPDESQTIVQEVSDLLSEVCLPCPLHPLPVAVQLQRRRFCCPPQPPRRWLQAEGALEGARRRLEGFVDSLDMEQLSFAAAEARLKDIQRLLKQCECASVEELREMAESAHAALEQAAELAGALPRRRSMAPLAFGQLLLNSVLRVVCRHDRRLSGALDICSRCCVVCQLILKLVIQRRHRTRVICVCRLVTKRCRSVSWSCDERQPRLGKPAEMAGLFECNATLSRSIITVVAACVQPSCQSCGSRSARAPRRCRRWPCN